jgi:hypothetical protein
MKKEKEYHMTCFTPEVIREAKTILECPLKQAKPYSMDVRIGEEKWSHDSDDEFFADIRKKIVTYSYFLSADKYSMNVFYDGRDCTVIVGAPSRSEIESIFSCFEKGQLSCKISLSELSEEGQGSGGPVIFIGHGRSRQWRDLKDHLHDQHGFEVQAYEVGARSGHAVRDVLEDMMDESSFALLVMTGEDRIQTGRLRARQNVVHELGLFQGRLGFGRAIILLEKGVQEFSNIYGINQIRFSQNHIKETFGDVLATINREFGTNAEESEVE